MSEQADLRDDSFGKPIPRVDGRVKVTGAARYPADEPIHNLAHAVLVTTDIACGRVAAVRDEEARRVPGVLDVVSHSEVIGRLARPEFGPGSTSIGPLHEPRVWHDGQILARSPTFNLRFSGPTSTTSPMNSWPTMSPDFMPSIMPS